jgi:hypothetical protein
LPGIKHSTPGEDVGSLAGFAPSLSRPWYGNALVCEKSLLGKNTDAKPAKIKRRLNSGFITLCDYLPLLEGFDTFLRLITQQTFLWHLNALGLLLSEIKGL